MADNKIELSPEEQLIKEEGKLLQEMVGDPGFQIVKGWFEDMAFHSWVDPRECPNKEEWEWRELNAFYGANIAREILERINSSISQAEAIIKKERGEVGTKSFKL